MNVFSVVSELSFNCVRRAKISGMGAGVRLVVLGYKISSTVLRVKMGNCVQDKVTFNMCPLPFPFLCIWA